MTASTAKPDVSLASERGLDLADQGRRYLPRQPGVGFSSDSWRIAAPPRTAAVGRFCWKSRRLRRM